MTVTLTAAQLAAATGADIHLAEARLSFYLDALEFYKMGTRLRMAHLFANVGVESGGFQFGSEIWGPTPAQNGYEGRLDLGNTQPGDGYLFRGRGDIETTGRTNYHIVTVRLRALFPTMGVPDFEFDPDSLALPHWAALSACDFVTRNGLNAFADAANFDGYCDGIVFGRPTSRLGDSNLFPRRLALYMAGMRVLP